MTDKPVIELSRREAMKLGATAVGVATVGVGVGPRQVAAQTVSDFISGTVVDGNGDPVANVWVLADPHNDNGSPINTLGVLATQTDANGDYEFSDVDLHEGTNFYQVYCRFGTSTDPQRARENYPWVEAHGFSPSDITSLAHWYDATEISASDGDSIATWVDQEGTDDLTQATGSKQPTYKTGIIGGDPVLRFDGSDDLLTNTLSSTLSQPNTIFVVLQGRTAGTDVIEFAIDGITSTNRHAIFTQANAAGDDWTIFAGSGLQSGTAEDTSPHIFTTLFDSTSSVIRQDATEIASGDAGTQSLTGLSVGAENDDTNHGDYDIGEVLMYDADLSNTDRDSVETYLSDKWGITI